MQAVSYYIVIIHILVIDLCSAPLQVKETNTILTREEQCKIFKQIFNVYFCIAVRMMNGNVDWLYDIITNQLIWDKYSFNINNKCQKPYLIHNMIEISDWNMNRIINTREQFTFPWKPSSASNLLLAMMSLWLKESIHV